MALKKIRLALARDHEFPEGSARHGYVFTAPIDDDGHLVADEWEKNRARCEVERFWPGSATEIGRLVHRPDGAWAFDYNPLSADDDEAGFKLQSHRFSPGEYVSFKEHDGVMRTFRVVSVSESV